MATYSEADTLMRQLKPIIDRAIENHPIVKAAIKVQKAVVKAVPDTVQHTVGIKFLSDLFDNESSTKTFPYNPNIPVSDLAVGKTVFVFYYQSLSNGVVMQNANWSI